MKNQVANYRREIIDIKNRGSIQSGVPALDLSRVQRDPETELKERH